MQRGLAPAVLLDTYGEERLRVIAQMLELTTELYKRTFKGGENRTEDEGAWKRGGDLRMLGVNYVGSSIVLEDAAVAGTNAYAAAAGSPVQAAYRAPDAPGLVRAGSDDAPTTLFDVFHISVHTVLLFGGGGGDVAAVAAVLARFPKDAVRAVLIVPQGQPTTAAADESALVLVLEDRAGHAYAGYGLVPGGALTAVVVRPDAFVGAVVDGADGLELYFQKIFV